MLTRPSDAVPSTPRSRAIDAQVRANEAAVALFSTYARKDGNAVLKRFAQQTLPTLEDLFKRVQTLEVGSAPRRGSD